MSELHTAPIRRLAQEYGTGRVEKEAVKEIKTLAEQYIQELVNQAAVFTEHADRRTLKREDISRAEEVMAGK